MLAGMRETGEYLVQAGMQGREGYLMHGVQLDGRLDDGLLDQLHA